MNEKMCKLLKIAQDIWAVLPSLPSRERGLKCLLLLSRLAGWVSLQSRERGLKSAICYNDRAAPRVAPLAGAWIEISRRTESLMGTVVAPLAGAWIEIQGQGAHGALYFVAPLAGAWIEIAKTSTVQGQRESRSPRGSVD